MGYKEILYFLQDKRFRENNRFNIENVIVRINRGNIWIPDDSRQEIIGETHNILLIAKPEMFKHI